MIWWFVLAVIGWLFLRPEPEFDPAEFCRLQWNAMIGQHLDMQQRLFDTLNDYIQKDIDPNVRIVPIETFRYAKFPSKETP